MIPLTFMPQGIENNCNLKVLIVLQFGPHNTRLIAKYHSLYQGNIVTKNGILKK